MAAWPLPQIVQRYTFYHSPAVRIVVIHLGWSIHIQQISSFLSGPRTSSIKVVLGLPCLQSHQNFQVPSDLTSEWTGLATNSIFGFDLPVNASSISLAELNRCCLWGDGQNHLQIFFRWHQRRAQIKIRTSCCRMFLMSSAVNSARRS